MKTRVIVVRPLGKPGLFSVHRQHYPSFEVVLSGDFRDVLKDDLDVKLQIRAVDADANTNKHKHGTLVIGEVKGKLAAIAGVFGHYTLEIPGPNATAMALSEANSSDAARTSAGAGIPQVGFAFRRNTESAVPLVSFALPVDTPAHVQNRSACYSEGDSWQLQVYAPELDIASPVFPVAWQRFVVPPRFHEIRRATYDWHAGNSLRFFTDAATNAKGTAGAFHQIAAAIKAAKKFIFIVDWSFHPTMRLDPTDYTVENCVGAELMRKASAGVTVAILTWHHSGPADFENANGWRLFKAIGNHLSLENPPSKNLM